MGRAKKSVEVEAQVIARGMDREIDRLPRPDEKPKRR